MTYDKTSRAAALLSLQHSIQFSQFPDLFHRYFRDAGNGLHGDLFPQHAQDVAVAFLLDAFFQALCSTFFRIFSGKASAIIAHSFRLLRHLHRHGNPIFCISCQMLQFHGKHGFKFPLAVCFQYNIVRCRAVRCKVKNIRTPPWLTDAYTKESPRIRGVHYLRL
jgi:hypothetical protein